MASRDIEPAVITRLRAALAAQVAAPLAVSVRSTQHRFGEDAAAYSDIDVRHGDAFAVVVVQGSLPVDELIVHIWQRRADEIWLVDRAEQVVTVVSRGGLIRVFEVGEVLRSTRVPEVRVPVSTIFGVAN